MTEKETKRKSEKTRPDVWGVVGGDIKIRVVTSQEREKKRLLRNGINRVTNKPPN
jgi:hypothetical protein